MSRPLIVLLAVLLPTLALGAAPTEKQAHHCLMLGYIYKMAADYRDNGVPPKDAYYMLLKLKDRPTKAGLKAIVNRVYFDPRFTYAGGQPLMTQVSNRCLGVKQYKPLQ